jgi:hypothetical protein
MVRLGVQKIQRKGTVMVIVVERTAAGFEAIWATDNFTTRAEGGTLAEAIGRLILNNNINMGIAIKYQ